VSPTAAPSGLSCLYEGSVRHRRMDTVADELHRRLFMAYLDLDRLPGSLERGWLSSARRPALAWFRRRDHFGDPDTPLGDCVRELVQRRTGRRPAGPIGLLTNLRCFGHCFNPVSFYYCFDAEAERVQAVVAEVTNTPWGERHCYVMDVARPADRGSVEVMRDRMPKRLHVSPLMSMNHVYDWRLTVPSERLLVHIESLSAADDTPVFDATLSLRRRELSSLGAMLARYPLITLRITLAIYAHALRLWLRGAPYFPHPRRAAPT